MRWPEKIDEAIEAIEEADDLTAAEVATRAVSDLCQMPAETPDKHRE